ncbi:MAG: ROK family transcriptional regulator [Rhodobacteraceae bacterium]|nr:ROK family transcriptional regulator [Paracoccaceae bacterium]MCF8520971.1 ROK family transcriptional regulator [Paracoccaceae bacterium]
MGPVIRNSARRLVTLLRSEGPMSRFQIASLLNVQPSTVTRLVQEMLEQGILAEEADPAREPRRGFPSKLIALRPDSLLSAGVFVDPDMLFTCIVDSHGNLLSEETKSILDRNFTTVLGDAGRMVERQRLALGLKASDFIGCGISYPGQHTNKPGKVLRTNYLSEWPDIDARTDLEPFFGMPVHQLNDAKSAGLAELLFGACKPIRNFCYIWLSYGIGGASIINQNLYLGANLASAEFGGLFPKSQPRPSGQDLLDTLRLAGLPSARLEDIPAEVLNGPVVAEWVDRAIGQIRWLSLVIARTFAPDAIVIGGRLADPILDRICTELAGPTPLGEDFALEPPKFLRATSDKKPQLGAAALPIYSATVSVLES